MQKLAYEYVIMYNNLIQGRYQKFQGGKSKMKVISILSSLLMIASLAACGSGTGGSSTGSPTISISMTDENGGSSNLSKFLVSSDEADCDPLGQEASTHCIIPNSYTVAIKKIEFINCDGDCVESDGTVTNESSSITVYEPSTSEFPTGNPINLATGATLSGDDIENVTAGSYGGLRFTITYLQQTIDTNDINLTTEEQSIFGTDDLTYRVCTMNNGCPDADGNVMTGIQAGDITVLIDGVWYYIDQDASGNPLTTTRPSNPLQDGGFANMGSGQGPDGDPDTGFEAEMVNDAGAVSMVDGGTYSIVSTFTIGYAFHFEDDNSNNLFDPASDGGAYPGKPQSIEFTAEEQ